MSEFPQVDQHEEPSFAQRILDWNVQSFKEMGINGWVAAISLGVGVNEVRKHKDDPVRFVRGVGAMVFGVVYGNVTSSPKRNG